MEGWGVCGDVSFFDGVIGYAEAHEELKGAFLAFLSGVMLSTVLPLNDRLEECITDSSADVEQRRLVYSYFGNTSKGFFTMFELTLGDWVPATRVLHDNVSEWPGPLLLLYQSVVTFAVIRVISGIFLHGTLPVAGSDDDLMGAQKERQMRKTVMKMPQLFVKWVPVPVTTDE